MQRHFKISVDGHEYDVAVTEVAEGPGNLYPDRGSMEADKVTPARVTNPPASAAVTQGRAQGGVPQSPPAAGPGDVVSPIAGVVVSIDVALNARVEAATRVATVEAMKTKTFINAGRSGTISAIAVGAGDPVEPGQAILTIA